MGNGSSSARPTSTITVQPVPSKQTNFCPVSSRFDSSPEEDNVNSRFQSNGSVTSSHHDATSYGYRSFQQGNLSSFGNEEEIDDSIENAVAPQYESLYDMEATTSNRKNKKKKKNLRKIAEEASDTTDEVVFEVYHAYDSGVEYTVINNDGVRFYLDSWTTGEWQPLPDEWLNHGYVEQQSRVNNNGLEDCISTSDIMIDNAVPGVGMDDDERMGTINHPLKGELITYMMDEQRHVNCVFDASSGAWLKLPLTWELHSPSITAVISHIRDTLPGWNDEHEILALLRQCNYDVDETITTYLTLLEDDSTWNRDHKSTFVGASLKDDLQKTKNEMQSLRNRISDLENIIRTKDNEIEEEQQRGKDLEEKLNYSKASISSLKNKLKAVQSDLEQAQQELKNRLEVKTPSPKLVYTPSPKIAKISAETIFAVRQSIESLGCCSQQLKSHFFHESNEFQSLIRKALNGVEKLNSVNHDSENQVMELRRLYNKEALHCKLLYNKLQELRGNIRVFCRCRHDPEAADVAVQFPSNQEIQAMSQMGKKTFVFDRVFDTSSSQQEVFGDTLPLITSCVDGYNVCIMAYGQTGSGKTYTMMGTDSNPGVNIRAIQELFHICKERQNIEYTLTVSMLEVYNETLQDLLADSSKPSQLNIQMKGKTVVVNNLTEIQVNSEGSINKIMAKGNANRSVGETKMNTNSSRSHLVLLLNIKGVDQISNSISHGTLTLVDLAGSERISKTEATGQRLIEAAAINKSLSALGQVFTALRTNAMHVPYRNSKLTQLLQASLGGDGKACLFVNVSPAQSNLAETLSTLNFGSAAKQVQLGKASQNVRKIHT